MADREKLIELINRSMNCCPPNVGGCRKCPYFIGSDSDWCDDSASIADHLIANGVTIQKWIPVTERLPEKHEHILALTPNKMHGGYTKWLIWYDPKSGFYDSDPEWGDIEMDVVTHWMPIPEPPKGE